MAKDNFWSGFFIGLATCWLAIVAITGYVNHLKTDIFLRSLLKAPQTADGMPWPESFERRR